MNSVVSKQVLNSGVTQLDIKAPNIANCYRPAQYITVTPTDKSERMIFTVFDVDVRRGLVSLFFDAEEGRYSELAEKRIGDSLHAVAGPFGSSFKMKPKSTLICMAQSLSVAGLLPISRYMKTQGVKVVAMARFQSRKERALESKLRVNCEKLLFSSTDERIQTENFWRNFQEHIKRRPNTVYIDGSLPFVRKVSDMIPSRRIRVIVNLMSVFKDYINPFELCRASINGREYYPAVDGLLADGQATDWQECIDHLQQIQEQYQWVNTQLRPSRRKRGSGIFPRLFSGLANARP